MWAWLKGATSSNNAAATSASPSSVSAPSSTVKATTAAASTTAAAPDKPAASTAAAALPVALDEHGKPIAIGGVTGTKPPTDGSFWGFMETNVTADNDPALDDMMSFFGFAHRERESDYVGCVSFELSYPDGQKSIRTVQVLPKGPQHAGAQIEEITSSSSSQEEDPAVQATAIRPEARAVRYQGPSATAVTPVAAPSRSSRLSSWFSPACSLYLPRIDAAHDSSASSSPSSVVVPAASISMSSSSSPPLPRMPFSSRVRIHRGAVPPEVRVTARLICSRDIFFEVYLGRLDPMRSVLTGKAHCPGLRYRELMYFGQSFDCSGEAWKRFYAKQKEIEEATKGRKGGGGAGGSSGGSGGQAQIAAPASSSSSSASTSSASLAVFRPRTSAFWTSLPRPSFSLSQLLRPASLQP
jgi:hypothetical protein